MLVLIKSWFRYLDAYILIHTENQPCKTFPADLCAVRITQPPSPSGWLIFFCRFCPSEFTSSEVCYEHRVKIEVFKAENDTALLYGDIKNSNSDKWIPCPDPVKTVCSDMKGSITFRKVRLHTITATRAGKRSTQWQERNVPLKLALWQHCLKVKEADWLRNPRKIKTNWRHFRSEAGKTDERDPACHAWLRRARSITF